MFERKERKLPKNYERKKKLMVGHITVIKMVDLIVKRFYSTI
jgi:hypothetical protein